MMILRATCYCVEHNPVKELKIIYKDASSILEKESKIKLKEIIAYLNSPKALSSDRVIGLLIGYYKGKVVFHYDISSTDMLKAMLIDKYYQFRMDIMDLPFYKEYDDVSPVSALRLDSHLDIETFMDVYINIRKKYNRITRLKSPIRGKRSIRREERRLKENSSGSNFKSISKFHTSLSKSKSVR